MLLYHTENMLYINIYIIDIGPSRVLDSDQMLRASIFSVILCVYFLELYSYCHFQPSAYHFSNQKAVIIAHNRLSLRHVKRQKAWVLNAKLIRAPYTVGVTP